MQLHLANVRLTHYRCDIFRSECCSYSADVMSDLADVALVFVYIYFHIVALKIRTFTFSRKQSCIVCVHVYECANFVIIVNLPNAILR